MTVSFIKFDGRKSTDFNLTVARDIGYSSSSYDVEQIVVQGRDGVLLKDNKRMNPVNYDIPLKIKTNGNSSKLGQQISDWLTVKGWKQLEFSWDKEHYYLASFVQGFDIKEMIEIFGSLNLSFLVHPIKYLKSGKESVNLTKGMTLKNTGNVISKPIITVTGSGNGTITINGRTTALENVQDVLVLDMEKTMVYSGSLPAWNKVVRSKNGSMPYFDIGNNTISWTGNFQISVVPNWGVKI